LNELHLVEMRVNRANSLGARFVFGTTRVHFVGMHGPQKFHAKELN
jgi:hypothetical protein